MAQALFPTRFITMNGLIVLHLRVMASPARCDFPGCKRRLILHPSRGASPSISRIESSVTAGMLLPLYKLEASALGDACLLGFPPIA